MATDVQHQNQCSPVELGFGLVPFPHLLHELLRKVEISARERKSNWPNLSLS